MFDQEAIDSYKEKLKEEAERQEELQATKEVADNVGSVKKAIEFQTARLISDKKVNPQNVRVLNNLASPDDIKQVVQGLDKLAVVLKPEANDDGPVIDAINSLRDQLIKLPSEMPEVEVVEEVTVKNISDFKGYIKPLLDAINKLELSPTFDPKIEVKPADVKITTEKLDTSELLQSIDTLSVEFGKLAKKEQPAVDLTKVIEATKATTKAINGLSFPVPNYVLPFSKDGKATQVVLDSSGNVPITGSLTSTPAKDSDRFGIQAISDDGTYKYFFFEADDADYYIMRKNLTTSVFSYTAGTGGYSTVYQSEILGPSGSPTWGNRGTVF